MIESTYKFTCDLCKFQISEDSNSKLKEYVATVEVNVYKYDHDENATVKYDSRSIQVCDRCSDNGSDDFIEKIIKEQK